MDNLELRCRAHNAYEAEQHFGTGGPEFVRERPPGYGPAATSFRNEVALTIMRNGFAESVSTVRMDASRAFLLLIVVSGTNGCILRPGMNSDCAWPSERSRRLNLQDPADRRHLVVDAELIEELVDRYRFHSVDEQRRCDHHLVTVVAGIHSVDVVDVARARARIPERGLDLPVTLPVAALFVFCVLLVLRRIERRFSDEPLPAAICLIAASVVLSGLFLWVGELWTSVLQMIRVGSQHVGGRVQRLPWMQHQQQIFTLGIGLFWMVVALRWARRRAPPARPPQGLH